MPDSSCEARRPIQVTPHATPCPAEHGPDLVFLGAQRQITQPAVGSRGLMPPQLALPHDEFAAAGRHLLADLRRVDRQVRDSEAQMRDALAAARTALTAIPGLGTVLAAKLLGHVGDVTRFPTERHVASYTGTAPLDAASGNNTHHRLNSEATARTACYASSRSARSATAAEARTTTCGKSPKARRLRKPAGPANECPAPEHGYRLLSGSGQRS